MKFRTFEDKIVDTSTMSHQHVSNLVHYMRYVNPDEESELFWLGVLQKFYKGELLPYKPHPKFIDEFETLLRKGYLKLTDFFKYDVVVNGIKIGQVDLQEKR